jgi:hypothetical protein
MFCTLLARYIPAISRAPSRPLSRSVAWIDATIVQPMSIESASRPVFAAPSRTFSHEYSTNAGVVIDAVSSPSASSPAYRCIRGPVPATYIGTPPRGVSASSDSAGTWAVNVGPLVVERAALEDPADDPDGVARRVERLDVVGADLLHEDAARAVAEAEPVRPAASWVTRASIATCTGWRWLNGEMIPQPHRELLGCRGR